MYNGKIPRYYLPFKNCKQIKKLTVILKIIMGCGIR